MTFLFAVVLYYIPAAMTTFRSRTLLLFAGDLVFFGLSLWLSLFFRAFEIPSEEVFTAHVIPFSLIFLFSVIIFFIAGLYESRSIIFARRTLSATLLVAQFLNVAAGALLFFFVPLFGIAPKTLLFIYLVVSFVLIFVWRVFLFPGLGLQRKEPAILVGVGREMDELADALRGAPHAPTALVATIAPGPNLAAEVASAVATYHPRFIIADFNDPRVSSAFPNLYNYLFAGIRFVEATALYEDVFGRIALSHINDQWIARNVSRSSHLLYDPFKRLMDIVVAVPAALVALVLYPFVALAILIDTGFPVFISMPRIGEGGRIINVHKFRSMTGNDAANYGADGTSKFSVTRVGGFIRLFRLDELPQLWEVIIGRQSLIGPRPESPSLVEHYSKEIPYYGVRHVVRPGLSGWAQLYHDNHPHHGAEVEATREKLSYDLYYLKHRSLLLDATIALKTIKKLLTRSGV